MMTMMMMMIVTMMMIPHKRNPARTHTCAHELVHTAWVVSLCSGPLPLAITCLASGFTFTVAESVWTWAPSN